MSTSNHYAPGWPGMPARWTSSVKAGVCTALIDESRVWFAVSPASSTKFITLALDDVRAAEGRRMHRRTMSRRSSIPACAVFYFLVRVSALPE